MGHVDRLKCLCVPRAVVIAITALMLLALPIGVAHAQRGQGQKKAQGQKKKTKATKVVVPAQTETIRFRFDEDRDPITRTFNLEARPPLKPKRDVLFEAGDLVTDEGDVFPQKQIEVTTEPSDFGNVQVIVTLTPRGKVDVEPGEYTGTLAVAGERIDPGAVTLSATLRDAKSKAIIWALLGFFIGLLVKIAGDFSRMKPGPIEQLAAIALLADPARKPQEGDPSTTDLERAAAAKRTFTPKDYFWSGSFFSSILLGLGGAGTAYALAYLANDSWGADSLDNWKVAAAAFAGVLTGVSGADLIKPFRPPAATPKA
jgi:hypothetical protein